MIAKTSLLCAAFVLAMWTQGSCEEKGQMYPDRWVYVARNLTKDEHVAEIKQIAETARAHGLNGMLLAAGLEGVARWTEDRLARLEKVKVACSENGIEIIPIIWSDMLDPNHNAHDHYYLVDGDLAGSWKYVPKDLVICCWYFKKREESMKFFSELGFETLAGAYYDGDTMENIDGWIQTITHTPKCLGIMYTTWRNKYKLLPDFSDAVRKDGNPM